MKAFNMLVSAIVAIAAIIFASIMWSVFKMPTYLFLTMSGTIVFIMLQEMAEGGEKSVIKLMIVLNYFVILVPRPFQLQVEILYLILQLIVILIILERIFSRIKKEEQLQEASK